VQLLNFLSLNKYICRFIVFTFSTLLIFIYFYQNYLYHYIVYRARSLPLRLNPNLEDECSVCTIFLNDRGCPFIALGTGFPFLRRHSNITEYRLSLRCTSFDSRHVDSLYWRRFSCCSREILIVVKILQEHFLLHCFLRELSSLIIYSKSINNSIEQSLSWQADRLSPPQDYGPWKLIAVFKTAHHGKICPATWIQVDLKAFWRWRIILRFIGFSDFVDLTAFQKLETTAFPKLGLLPSSDDDRGNEPTLLGSLERKRHWG
jgi:hypothetical protein